MFTRDLARRIAAAEDRITRLDEHGTRGVDSIKVIQAEQARDLGKIEAQVAAVSVKLDGITSRQWQRLVGFALAVLPIYVLLFLAVFGVKPGG